MGRDGIEEEGRKAEKGKGWRREGGNGRDGTGHGKGKGMETERGLQPPKL